MLHISSPKGSTGALHTEVDSFIYPRLVNTCFGEELQGGAGGGGGGTRINRNSSGETRVGQRRC